jgi:hypothetical protein
MDIRFQFYHVMMQLFIDFIFKNLRFQDYEQWRTEVRGGWGSKPPLPKFRRFDKAEPNSQFRGKCIRNNPIRIPVSLICKLSGTAD